MEKSCVVWLISTMPRSPEYFSDQICFGTDIGAVFLYNIAGIIFATGYLQVSTFTF